MIQRPELVAAEAQLAHSQRKAEKAAKQAADVGREVEKQEAQLLKLNKELDNVKKLAQEAQGTVMSRELSSR